MVNEECRLHSTGTPPSGGITANNTSNATRHLFDVHGVVSMKSKKTRQRAAKHKATITAANDNLRSNPTRAMLIMFVKIIAIWNLCAFSWGDDAKVKTLFAAVCIPAFPQSLYPRLVKKVVAELYAATIKVFAFRLSEARRGAGESIVHANIDLWTSKNSNEKYIGLRVHWMTATVTICTALLVVKLFRPAPELSDSMKLSDVLRLRVGEVLAEYGMSESDLCCTVTDAKSDVKRLCLKVLDSKWEWCFSHMLYCTLVEMRDTTLCSNR
ncbi:unnamed protein product [Sphacelaria rigidula]